MPQFVNEILAYVKSPLLPAVIVLVVGLLLIRLAMKLVDKVAKNSTMEKTAFGLIRTFVRVVLYGLLALIVASKLGFDVTGIVALASVLTLAVSLSVQNLLTNLVSGFTLLYTKPFVAGDFVEIAGQSGTVQEIGLTYTKLITADNKTVYIPNGSVTATEIVNFTVLGTRRVDVSASASYDTPIEEVLAALREAGNVPTALDTPAPYAAVTAYGESNINYTLQVWCKAEDYWTTLFDTNKNVKVIFEKNGVKMSYPHVNVHMDK